MGYEQFLLAIFGALIPFTDLAEVAMAATKGKAGSAKAKVSRKSTAQKSGKTAQKKTKTGKAVSASAKAPLMAEHPEGLFSRFNALRSEMDNLFSSMNRSFGLPEFKVPALEFPSRTALTDVRFEVSENDKALEVKAEVPGLGEDDINIELADGLLTVKGEKRDTREEKEKDYYVHECRYGSFSRSFRVPDSVVEDDIKADLEKGVLKITLPKKASPKRSSKTIKPSASS